MTIGSLAGNSLQSILSNALQEAASTRKTTNSPTKLAASSATQDTSHLSPLAQLMSTLQQLQQSDPNKYQQVTQQIATNLQAAAQTAQSQGNTTAANQLNQLAVDFTKASKSGQLPDIQDLAQAVGGHRQHHHHAHAAAADADADSSANSSSSSASSSTASSTSASDALTARLSAFQANGTQSDTLNPMNIIHDTLASAGIKTSNS